MSRWVCLRCYESNDEATAACKQCGLLRGATPAEGDTYQPAAQPTSQARRTPVLLSLALRFWWVLAIGVVAVGGLIFNAQRNSEGEITHGGTLVVTDLRVGDCFDLKDPDEEITEEVDARPCTEAHQYELYFAGSMADGPFPTDDVFEDWVAEACLPAFDSYVGLAYLESRFELLWFQPTADGWDQGDHEVSCAVYDPAEAELTSAIRNSAR
jgi:hypothetical protein